MNMFRSLILAGVTFFFQTACTQLVKAQEQSGAPTQANTEDKKTTSKDTTSANDAMAEAALIEILQVGEKAILVDLTRQQCMVAQLLPDKKIKSLFVGECTSGRVSRAGGDNRPTPVTLTAGSTKYTVVTKMEVDGYSTTYSCNMPYMVQLGFTDEKGNLRGIAIHQGHLRNYPSSHACIRLGEDTAKEFYSLVQVGMKVFTYGDALEFQRNTLDLDDLIAYQGKRPVFKATLPGATREDKDTLFEHFKAHKLQIDYKGRGDEISLDKSFIKFRFETMPQGTGISVADFERMYGIEITLKPPVLKEKAAKKK